MTQRKRRAGDKKRKLEQRLLKTREGEKKRRSAEYCKRRTQEDKQRRIDFAKNKQSRG